MSGDHDRYDELAVGHVLGGLDDAAAADFRSHLLRCRDCRLRVVELRDLATDLAEAEREERAQLRTKIEVESSGDGDEAVRDRWRPLRTAAFVGIAVVVILALPVLLFWNLHLRSVNDELLSTAEIREAALEVLATGEALSTSTSAGVVGLVARDDEQVAMSLSGVPTPAAHEVVVVWVLPGTGPAAVYGAGAMPEGRLASVVSVGDAQRLVITLEEGRPGTGPDGQSLMEVDLGDG